MCVQRGDALQLGPSRAVYELPWGINGCPRSRITGIGVLEYREDFLSALRHAARYNSQLIFDGTAGSGMVGLGGWRLDQDDAQGSRAVHTMDPDELDINGGAGTADPGERAPGAH